MVSILKSPKTKARLSYNGFDLSKRVLFTSSVGQLLPVLYDYLSPSEKISINSSLFTRTQPMRTSAFVRITEHIDYFFVPVKLINSYFSSMYYGIQDFGSSLLPYEPDVSHNAYDSKMPPSYPMLTNDNLVTLIDDALSETSVGGFYLTKYTDSFGCPLLYNFFRLASMLGYSEKLANVLHTENNVTWLPNLNLNLFYCYQKIFSDYYRLTDWLPNDTDQWSMDKLMKVFDTDNYDLFRNWLPTYTSTTSNFKSSPFELHYRPFKKDFFTNVKPSPLFSVYQSASGLGLQQIIGGDIGNTEISNPTDWQSIYGARDNQFTHGSLTDSPFNVTFNNTLSSLRVAFAWEKYLGITNRAGAHYDRQTLAHFGYSVPKGISDEVYYLGSHSSVLKIGEVVGSATTDKSVLGEIAGRGLGVSGKQKTIKFTAPCHGYLMAIYSAVPEADYNAYGLDRLNTYSKPQDYYHPEFDRLGMQPVFGWQSFVGSVPSSNYNQIIGWQYRYSELKSKYDTIHGAFNYTLRDWVAPRQANTYTYNGVPSTGQFSFGNWVYTNFFISPSQLDSIFLVNFLPTYSSTGYPVFDDVDSEDRTLSRVFENDPLLHSLDFRYYKTSPMSTYGLPNL